MEQIIKDDLSKIVKEWAYIDVSNYKKLFAMDKHIFSFKSVTSILSLGLWIIMLYSCEKVTPEKQNTPPIIELVQPTDSIAIYAGTTVLFEFNISDPDGVINSWGWNIIYQKGEMMWSDVGTPNESSITLSFSREFQNADAGDCVMEIIATDNNMEVSELKYQWEVKDYRGKYVGMWDFNGIRHDWNMNWDPISVDNPYSYSGSVDYGSTDSTIFIDFCSEPGIEIVVSPEGKVRILPGDYYLSVEFISTDSLYLNKSSTARGAATKYSLTGVKK